MHPEIGANMVRPVDFLVESGIMHMILYHHERYDGKGYPHGLSGRKIPIGARIIAVADTLSALIQDRPYRKRKGFDEAAAEIFRCSGTQFDPMVIGGFLDAQGKIREWLE